MNDLLMAMLAKHVADSCKGFPRSLIEKVVAGLEANPQPIYDSVVEDLDFSPAFSALCSGGAVHVPYPHEPGRLYDCPACEAKCHCKPDETECIWSGHDEKEKVHG